MERERERERERETYNSRTSRQLKIKIPYESYYIPYFGATLISKVAVLIKRTGFRIVTVKHRC